MKYSREGRHTYDPAAARACVALMESEAARTYAAAIGFKPCVVFENPMLRELAERAMRGAPIDFALWRLFRMRWPDGAFMTLDEIDATIDDILHHKPMKDDLWAVEAMARRHSAGIAAGVFLWAVDRLRADGGIMRDVADDLLLAIDRAACHDPERPRGMTDSEIIDRIESLRKRAAQRGQSEKAKAMVAA